MPDQLSVLFVHGITQIGGAERELLLMMEHLPSFGYEPLVVSGSSGPLIAELDRRAIAHHNASLPPWRKMWAYPRRSFAVRQLREIIDTRRPSLLHVNDIWWVPQAVRAAAGTGIPVVAHVRQEIEPAKVRRYDLHRVDMALAVSRRIEESLQIGSVPPERTRTLYSGLDPARIPSHTLTTETRTTFGISATAPLIGTVANLFPRKGYETMLQAMRRIIEACPDAQYLIIGQGDRTYEQSVKNLASSLGLNRHVHFTGFQASVNPLLAALDLYVHPALMEGFGLAVLEAMAMGKPIVATKTGGVPEIVEDGKTGVLVPPGDSAALATAVVALLKNRELARSMGAAGRDRATLFSLEAMMAGLTAAYAACLKTAPLPSAHDMTGTLAAVRRATR